MANDAVEFALRRWALRAALLQFSAKDDLVSAVKAVDAAAMKAPNDTRIQSYRISVVAAKEAQDKVLLAAAQYAEKVKVKIAQLSKDAWAARNNFLDSNGGFVLAPNR